MKHLIFTFCLLFSIQASSGRSLFSENSFVAVVRNKQSGIFYGDALIREMVNTNVYSGVFVLYKDPSRVNTRTERSTTYKKIADRLNSIQPAIIYISSIDSELMEYIDFQLRSRVKVLPSSHSARITRYSREIDNFLIKSKLDFESVFILTDQSQFSSNRSDIFKNTLEKTLKGKKIEVVDIKDFQGVRKFIGSLSTPSVIINNLNSLIDVELGIYKYSDDIKREIIDYNTKHLDIGFEVAAYNESIIIEDSAKDLLAALKGEGTYIRVSTLINKQRLRKLGMNKIIVNYFYEIDGLVQ